VTARHVILIGMMGSGKTTVGRVLAERLGRPFIDSDEQVEARTGRTVREIWEEDGEAAFRALERDALVEALRSDEPTVIAAAGGTVLDAANRDALRAAGTVLWLQASPEVLAARVDRASHRPLLADDPLGTLRRLDAERASLYLDVADVVVGVGDTDLECVVDKVAELVA
jgi:shikimate kinase